MAGLAATDRLQDTVGDLLALAPDTPRSTDPLDVDAVLDEVRDQWRARGLGRTLTVRCDRPPVQAPPAVMTMSVANQAVIPASTPR